jgi:hypothetical protein
MHFILIFIQGGKDEVGNVYQTLYYYRYDPIDTEHLNFTKIPLNVDASNGLAAGAVQSYAVFWGGADPNTLHELDTNQMIWTALKIPVELQYGTIIGCGDFLVLSGKKK